MSNRSNSNRKIGSQATFVALFVALIFLSLGTRRGIATLNVVAMPGDICIARALVKVEKVQYQGKDSGNDKVLVEWRDAAPSPCVYFGGGFDVPGQANIPPFGHEITVRIKRKNGHEDTGTSKSNLVVNGNQLLSDVITIPRGLLETDPVSFDVKLRTTAGVVMVQTVRLTGNGVPLLMNATQKFTPHASVPNVLGTCFPQLQVPTLNFTPGTGASPDQVTIGLATALPQLADCFDGPKVTVVARVTRSNGIVDVGQANVAAGQTTTTIPLSGAAGSVSSFEIIVTASAGSVIEKTAVSSGSF